MPRIPAGIVETPWVDVLDQAKPLELTPPIIAEVTENGEPHIKNDDGFYCLKPDGSIDNKAQTNKTAQDVSNLLEQEIDVKCPVFCAGIIVLIGGLFRFKHKAISEFTGLPRQFCDKVCFNLRYSKLIQDGQISSELATAIDAGTDGLELTVIFVMYCLVGAGQCWTTYDQQGTAYWQTVPANDHYIYRIQAVA